jgi:hypothetical protein
MGTSLAVSPAYCNSGYIYVIFKPIFACATTDYIDWRSTNTFFGCVGSTALMGRAEDFVRYLNTHSSLVEGLFVDLERK